VYRTTEELIVSGIPLQEFAGLEPSREEQLLQLDLAVDDVLSIRGRFSLLGLSELPECMFLVSSAGTQTLRELPSDADGSFRF
jgi:hypothetical protein